jgi:methylated-DNA-[protein]-cysteine S-methyltransferase
VTLEEKIHSSHATIFQKAVWIALCAIPKGTTTTYKQLAAIVGRPRAVRAVANAIGSNPFAPEVPCHRVVRSDGGLGGYSGKGGIKTKLALLKKEGVTRYS